mmetsp:Transcript_19013/g.37542  ORF Transcript_19013/g.37542 Transcript_19013/m.37542 type:complete len:83 (-) Transcript_19013:115-363(-)
MVLTVEDAGKLVLLTTDAKPGSKLVPDGGVVEPEKDFDIKKKFSKLDLKTGENGIASWCGVPLQADGQQVSAPGMGAGLKIK